MPDTGPAALVSRLSDAVNSHDLDALVDCFAADYRNETPAHPSRDFTGREQVRKNWTQILAAVPDLHTDVLRCSVDGRTAWSEWEQRGTRADGTPHLMRGVVIFDVHDDRAVSARFYLEPVDTSDEGVDAAVRRQVDPAGPR